MTETSDSSTNPIWGVEPAIPYLPQHTAEASLHNEEGAQSLEVRPAHAEHSSPQVPEHATGKDVLVVDDEPYLCDLIGSVLEMEGHTTRIATNGLEALKQVRERRPDLILLDLMMPVMDGWQFLEAMRADPATADIPVVLITAVYDARGTQRQTGAKAVLTKPFDIDQLGDLVRRHAE